MNAYPLPMPPMWFDDDDDDKKSNPITPDPEDKGGPDAGSYTTDAPGEGEAIDNSHL